MSQYDCFSRRLHSQSIRRATILTFNIRRNYMKSYTFIIALVFAWISASANAEVLKVSALTTGEEIRIEFSSRGCFHDTKYFYVLRGGSERVLDVSEAKATWNAEKKKLVDLGVVKIGTVSLTGEDTNGLDSLFTFYRMKNPGVCTTTDHIKVEYVRAGTIIGKEEFIDSSCATSSIQLMKEDESYRKRVGERNWSILQHVITFDDLTARIQKDGPQKADTLKPNSNL